MGLVRLFLYDQPMSIVRFLAELAAFLVLLALTVGFVAATTLKALQ
jgi:hypothetical protein